MHNCSKVVDELLDYRVNLVCIRYCWIWGFFGRIHLYGNVLVVIYSTSRLFHVCTTASLEPEIQSAIIATPSHHCNVFGANESLRVVC